jgi:exodeoxyribonuclease VII large subunit
MSQAPTVSVGQFVGLLNQTLEYAYPDITITGELAHFNVRKDKWVYFDLKDDIASVRFFGTVYQLPGPLEDGMMLAVRGMPRLHPKFGFTVNVQSMRPLGEGSIKKAADLLKAKLTQEGLFDESRKRALPYPPEHIGLIASSESAAYHDFTKVLGARWGGMKLSLADVAVQGEMAASQIIAAIEHFNQTPQAPDVLVVTRGGGSTEDLQAFSDEQLTRAVAASRIPTLVAIGHEVDVSLAELAADRRASTPSNAAEMLVPDRRAELTHIQLQRDLIGRSIQKTVEIAKLNLYDRRQKTFNLAKQALDHAVTNLNHQKILLGALDPNSALRRGYALLRKDNRAVYSASQLAVGDNIEVKISDATLTAEVKKVTIKE